MWHVHRRCYAGNSFACANKTVRDDAVATAPDAKPHPLLHPLLIEGPSCSAGAEVTRDDHGDWFALVCTVDGVKEGPFVAYRSDGSVSEKGAFHKNQRSGISQSFYTNGTPETAGNMVDGHRDGEWTIWDGDGSQRKQVWKLDKLIKGNLDNDPFGEGDCCDDNPVGPTAAADLPTVQTIDGDDAAWAILKRAEAEHVKPRERAKAANDRGYRLFNVDHSLDRALDFFEYAAKTDAKYGMPRFSAAKCYAARGDVAGAVRYLGEIKAMGRSQGDRLKTAQTDPAFASVANDPLFQALFR